VSKAIADEAVEMAVAEALDSQQLTVFASAKEIADARKELDRAKAVKTDWLEKAELLTAEELETGLAPKRKAVELAQERYDELVAAAEESTDLPKDGTAFRKLDGAGQRRVANLLVEKVVVSPPLASRVPADRVNVVPRGGR
jgi:hypothetical protein